MTKLISVMPIKLDYCKSNSHLYAVDPVSPMSQLTE